MTERDYISRTIATVRNHRDADNCWPQWANIFADEIERLRSALEKVAAPKRPDGTYNLSREACEQIAREALAASSEETPE